MKNLKSSSNIEVLKKAIKSYCTTMSDFCKSEIQKSLNGKTLNELQSIMQDFLNRNALNIQAVVPLLDLYKTKRDMILPIGLILRSIYSDFLTQLYLMTFCEKDTIVTESFKNELKVLDRDFINSMVKIMEYEAQLGQYIDVVPKDWLGEKGTIEKIAKVKTSNPHLYNTNGSLKSVADLRSSSDRSLFSKYGTEINKPSGSSFMSESYKWNRIENHPPFKKYVLALFGYKLFSQFQHYSNRSSELLSQKQEAYGFYYLCLSLNALAIISKIHIQTIDDSTSPALVGMEKVIGEVQEIFKG